MKLTREDLGMLLKVAETVFESGVCPKDITSPKACFAVMLAGGELGLGPMQSIRCIQIVKGKLSFTSEFTVAQCVNDPRCKFFTLIESTDKVAIFETLREGSATSTRLSYNLQQAQRAGLLSSNTWKNHPEAMLRARCAMALARAVYPDLVTGMRVPDEVEEIEREAAPVPQLPAPPRATERTQEPPVEASAAQSAAQPPAQPIHDDPHPALTAFTLRVEEIELPGESVAVWFKHREDLAAAGADVVDAAWKALCEKTRTVGRMGNPKVWLEKAIAEEDARRGAAHASVAAQPTEPPALVNYRTRCALAPSLDALAAVCLELAPTVAQHREDAWGVAVRRAADLGADEPTLKDLVGRAAAITKEPAVWKVAAEVLVGLAAATTRDGVAAVVKRYGGAVAKLPKAISEVLLKARDARLAEITPVDLPAQLEDEIKRATSLPDLDAAGERVERELAAGRLTPDQAKALTALHEKAAAAMEMAA